MTLGREEVRWYGQNSGNFVAFDEVTVWDRKDCGSRLWFLCLARVGGVEEEWHLCTCPHQKRRYWPKHVPGDAIIEHFNNKEVGETDAIHGELDEVQFYLYGMKEPDYIMQIMLTYGTLHEKGLEKKDTSPSMEKRL